MGRKSIYFLSVEHRAFKICIVCKITYLHITKILHFLNKLIYFILKNK